MIKSGSQRDFLRFQNPKVKSKAFFHVEFVKTIHAVAYKISPYLLVKPDLFNVVFTVPVFYKFMLMMGWRDSIVLEF